MIIQHNKNTPGVLVLAVAVGSLDISNAAAFREETSPLISASADLVELDCSKLEFIDSSGVGALLHVNKLLPAERRPVRLTGVGKKVISLLELMHVHRSFDLNPAK